MPPEPEQFPHVTPQPTFKAKNRPDIIGKTVILPPAAKEHLPLLAQLRTGAALSVSPQLAHFGFKTLNRRIRYRNAVLAVQPEPQKLPLRGFADAAFAAVDLQLQPFFNPAADALHHPAWRPFRFPNVDIAVVRISAETMTLWLPNSLSNASR